MRLRSFGLALAPALLCVNLVQADPQANYLLHCGGCHLENGEGTLPEVPDLRHDLDWLAQTAEGRSYLTRVPGASQVPLSDQKLADIYNWMFDVFYPPHSNIPPFSGEEIARTRGLPLWDPLSARKALLSDRKEVTQAKEESQNQ
ncbi:c-type cytochrome [Congregibacter sp.]|uniref:c-type cytochrome n=1 Tax=Congregibacter sp. TaxID=2744308 RepID=UPI00385A8CAA